MEQQENKSSIGSIAGTIIIIAIIILGGLYFWGKRIEETKQKEDLITDSSSEPGVNSETNAVGSVSSSDDLNAIEADLNATDINNLDQGAAVIEAELQ